MGKPRLELYLRSLAPTKTRDSQEQILRQVQRLDDQDRISGFEVVLCGECVCPSLKSAETEVGQRLLRRYDEFERWAEQHERDLVAFQQRNRKSMLTDTSITGVKFPRITIAEYRDGELDFVAPSSNGTEETNVTDLLETYSEA